MGKASWKKEQPPKQAPSTQVTTLPQRHKPRDILTQLPAALLLIALLATLIYSNTFSASFHFDDNPNIVENPRIKDLSNFRDFSGTRYVGFLSFALNYRFGGLNVFGYHLVNLLIHIVNGFLVYHLVLLLFRASHSNAKPESGQPHRAAPTLNPQPAPAPWIALATALLFVAHPIQTQAVTYIVQRFASLAALFYLLAVVCYLKWRSTPSEDKGRPLWYAGALLSTVLGMKTKENSFTLPLMILLVEAVFFRSIFKKQWITLIPFLVTLLIIPFSRIDAVGEAEVEMAQETTEIGRFDYLLTQFRVIVTYLRLLIFPINQNLDYDYPIYHSLLEQPVLLSFLFLLSLFIWSPYLLFNSKFKTHPSHLIAFGILWFFLTLSVESSIIPIRDVIFEHRAYLPMVGFCLAMLVGIEKGMEALKVSSLRGVAFGLGIVLLFFSLTTYQRNGFWKDDASLWEDVVRKSPRKARAHYNLGVAQQGLGFLDKAIQQYQIAVELKPDYAEAYNNLGIAYKKLGQLGKAIQVYRQVLERHPDFAVMHFGLGDAFAEGKRFEEAIQEYLIALKLKPDYAKAHNNLGIAYSNQGRLNEAIREYQIALQLQPDFAAAHNNVGSAFAQLGRLDEATKEYQIALRLQPDFPLAHTNLGVAYSKQGRMENAIREYQIALEFQPDDVEAHNNLGNAYSNQGRLNEAIREYQIALLLQPNLGKAHNNMGNAYSKQGHFEEAIQEYQTAIGLEPNDQNTHYNLGLAYARSGRLEAAKKEYKQALQIKPDFEPARKALTALSH